MRYENSSPDDLRAALEAAQPDLDSACAVDKLPPTSGRKGTA